MLAEPRKRVLLVGFQTGVVFVLCHAFSEACAS